MENDNICPNPNIQRNNTLCPYNKLPKPVLLTEVIASPILTLDVSLKYTDKLLNHVVRIEKGIKYKITYMADGNLNEVIGLITGITKITKPVYRDDGFPSDPNEYLIRIDASSSYASNIITIKTTQLRGLVRYIPHADEDNTIPSSTTHGGITVGTIKNITVEQATYNEKTGEISDGKISGGNVSGGGTSGGSSSGNNTGGSDVTVINGYTTGGSITATIIKGTVTEPKISGGTYVDGIYTGCTITATSAKIIANNSTITNGKTTGGTILDVTMKYSTVTGGTRTGTDMVTVGGTIIDGICYGGQTTGGTLQGGSAVGTINDSYYTIKEGTTTGGYTTGGKVIGGTVIGGYTIGNTTIGATIIGGTEVDGITTGGTTIGGVVIPGGTGIIKYNDITDKLSVITNKPDVNTYLGSIDGFIVWYLENYGVGSNVATYDFKL